MVPLLGIPRTITSTAPSSAQAHPPTSPQITAPPLAELPAQLASRPEAVLISECSDIVKGIMDEQKTSKTIRPTKRQKELLTFIEEFIAANGYSPSYREIMNGLKYTSVATVALHVNSLIKRGHLQKRDRSARSLEVVKPKAVEEPKVVAKQLKTSEEKWLVDKVELFFKEAENKPAATEAELDQLFVLIGALKVLGASGAANAFTTRLGELKKKQSGNQYVV